MKTIHLSALLGVTNPEFLAQCYGDLVTLPSDKTHSFLIDPFLKRVVAIIHDEPMDLKAMYSVLGCSLIDHCCHQENGDMIFVDDEGLSKEAQSVFWVEGFSQFFAGKGLWVGTSEETGDTVSPATTFEKVCAAVSFTPPIGFIRLVK